MLEAVWLSKNVHRVNEGKFELKQSEKYAVSGENLTLLKTLLGTTFDALYKVKIANKTKFLKHWYCCKISNFFFTYDNR